MNTTHHAGSPLRQRMFEDTRMRKLAPSTQEAYIRAVRSGWLSQYCRGCPSTTAPINRMF